jgi:hypothetical protein
VSNLLDDDVALDAQLEEINTLERHLDTGWPRFARRKPLRLREAKAGKWVAYREDLPDRHWTAEELAERLSSLRSRAVVEHERVADRQRMDALNARVRTLLGDADFEFYTNTLIGYGMPRG